MTFELTDYRKKMDNNVYATILATMEIRVDANGHREGEGTHVSVFACLIKGKYDDNLNWPFVGEIITELLNQLEDKNQL